MKRRNFLSLLGATALAPALPAMGAPAGTAATVGYNRYMYGLAVFHARTRVGVTVADLMGRLGVSSSQARAMMSEMTKRGVLSGVTGAAAKSAVQVAPRKPYVRKMLRDVHNRLIQDTRDTATETPTRYRHNTDVIPTSQNAPKAGDFTDG